MENLKKLRENAGISQQRLANELGLTQQKVYSYENDIYEPDIKTLIQLATYFNTSVDFLIGNTNIQHKIEKVEPYDLNSDEAEFINKFRNLSQKSRASLQLIMDNLK